MYVAPPAAIILVVMLPLMTPYCYRIEVGEVYHTSEYEMYDNRPHYDDVLITRYHDHGELIICGFMSKEPPLVFEWLSR